MAIHAVATEHVDECPLLQARIFDYNYLRWETTYFLDRFVVGLRKRQVTGRPSTWSFIVSRSASTGTPAASSIATSSVRTS